MPSSRLIRFAAAGASDGHHQEVNAAAGRADRYVNLARAVGKLADVSIDTSRLRELLITAGVRLEPLLSEDAELAGATRSLQGGRALSLGDRCCLALTRPYAAPG